MKKMNMLAAGALLMGLTGAAYAGMGQPGGMKCGRGMGMKGDFATQKSMMLKHLDEMEKCVEAAKTKTDLQQCRTNMMQKRRQMMQGKQGKKMQCGTGKCSGGK